MSRDILEQAIEKAVSNGWGMFGYLTRGSWRSKQFTRYYFTDQNYTYGAGGARQDQLSIESRSSTSIFYLHISISEIIFDHDFAKAFWPGNVFTHPDTNKLTDDREIGCKQEAFAYHLQEMVLEENPIKYLEQFLLKEV